jgi:antitoxin ParD1/3/4
MDDLIVSIPSSEREFIDAQVASGKYDTPTEAVRDLIRQAQLQAERERFESLIREGIATEGAVKYSPEWLEAKRDASLAKLRSRPSDT